MRFLNMYSGQMVNIVSFPYTTITVHVWIKKTPT